RDVRAQRFGLAVRVLDQASRLLELPPRGPLPVGRELGLDAASDLRNHVATSRAERTRSPAGPIPLLPIPALGCTHSLQENLHCCLGLTVPRVTELTGS